MNRLKKLILFIFLLLFASCTQPKADPNYVKMDFKNLSVNEFLEKISEITGKKIITNEEIKGKINFVSNKKGILKSELIPLANAVLETKKLTLVSYGTHYGIVKSISVPSCYFPIKEIKEESFTTKVFLLENLNGAVIRTKIKPLLIKGSKITYSKLVNRLSVTSSNSSLKSIGKLIDKLKEQRK